MGDLITHHLLPLFENSLPSPGVGPGPRPTGLCLQTPRVRRAWLGRDPQQPRGLKGMGRVSGLPGLGAGAQLSCAVWGLPAPGLGSGPDVS